MARACSSCFFATIRKEGDDNNYTEFYCHRFPPTVFMAGKSPLYFSPIVSEDDWCGEWRARGKYKRDKTRKDSDDS